MLTAEQKRLIINLGAIAALVDDLEKIGSISRAEAEAKSRLAACERDANKLKADADKAMAEANAKAETLVANAEARAKGICAKAETTLAEANAAAREVVASANAQADKVLTETRAILASLQHEAAVSAEARDAAELELKDIEAKIAKARQVVASLVAG